MICFMPHRLLEVATGQDCPRVETTQLVEQWHQAFVSIVRHNFCILYLVVPFASLK